MKQAAAWLNHRLYHEIHPVCYHYSSLNEKLFAKNKNSCHQGGACQVMLAEGEQEKLSWGLSDCGSCTDSYSDSPILVI